MIDKSIRSSILGQLLHSIASLPPGNDGTLSSDDGYPWQSSSHINCHDDSRRHFRRLSHRCSPGTLISLAINNTIIALMIMWSANTFLWYVLSKAKVSHVTMICPLQWRDQCVFTVFIANQKTVVLWSHRRQRAFGLHRGVSDGHRPSCVIS